METIIMSEINGKVGGSDELSAFRNNVINLLLKRKWTQKQLARRAGISQMKVSRFLHGRTAPTLADAIRVSRAFRVSLSGLVKGTLPQEK